MALVKYNNNSISAITSVAGLSSGAMVLIKEQTASDGDATVSFVDGTSDVVLDNTYPIYLFKWINVHPTGDGWSLTFQANVAGGSGYNETITSTHFKAQHSEAGSSSFSYLTGMDQAQGTSFQSIGSDLGNDADQSCCGELWLFNPSSTTYTKHFIATANDIGSSNFSVQSHVAGYFNTTSAIDEIRFQLSNIGTPITLGSGTFKLYGIKDS